MKLRYPIIVIAIVSLWAVWPSSAIRLDPRSMSMGGANMVSSRGVEGALSNPANLGLSGNTELAIKYFHLGLIASNNSFRLKDYNRVSGSYLGDAEKRDLLSSVPASGFHASSAMDAVLMGICGHRTALNLNLRSTESIRLPKDIFDLALFGNQIDRNYRLAYNNMGEGWTIISAGISCGYPLKQVIIKEFSLGMGIKYLAGINYAKVDGEMAFRTSEEGFYNNGNISVLTVGENDYNTGRFNINGSGVAADIGVAGRINQYWSFGISLVDLSPGITWTREIKKRYIYTEVNGIPMEYSNMFESFIGDSVIDIQSGSLRSAFPGSISSGLSYCSRNFCSEFCYRREIGRDRPALR